MDCFVCRTPHGLVPYSDEDEEKMSSITMGRPMKITINSARNLPHHRKYFKLIQTCWDYQPEGVKKWHGDKEHFRKCLEISCGHCDVVWCMKTNSWVEIPKSIAFDKMSQEEFSELYDKVMALICDEFLTHLTDEDKNNFFEILDGNKEGDRKYHSE